MNLHRVVFSAPFGNWFGGDGVTRTFGSFTTEFRGSMLYRLWRIARTVRYSPLFRAWVNKLGLPNPGVESWLNDLIRPLDRGHPVPSAGHIVSLYGFSAEDWSRLLERAFEYTKIAGWPVINLGPRAFELNMSCPNVKHDPMDYDRVFREAMQHRTEKDLRVDFIVKLPPVRWERIAEAAVTAGIRTLHCCNTLPVKRGGMSGKPLMAISLSVVAAVRRLYGQDVTIIGGGGITRRADMREYEDAGATHFAVGSALFLPWYRWRMRKIAKELLNTPRTG